MWAAAVATAQFVGIATEPEPAPREFPASSAPRRKLEGDFDGWLASLLAPEAGRRNEALRRLGMEFVGEPSIADVRVFAVNLDADADLERVVQVSGGLDGEVTVWKKEEGAWWNLAHFVCRGPGGRAADPLLELRPVVRYGTNDLILHAGGSQGTGVGERRLQIYRLWGGRAYRVLDLIESAYNMSGWEETRIRYPDPDSTESPAVIVLQREKEFRGRRSSR